MAGLVVWSVKTIEYPVFYVFSPFFFSFPKNIPTFPSFAAYVVNVLSFFLPLFQKQMEGHKLRVVVAQRRGCVWEPGWSNWPG
jgi:hypothetical protein